MSTALTLLIVLGWLFALFTFLAVMVLVMTWIERKFLGRIQMRMGPMRVGFHGLLQPVADAVKLLVKEDIMPSWVNRPIYWIAPLAVLVPVFVIWLTIPFAEGWVIRNLELGLLYIIAFSVLSIVGLVLAGWGSASKYGVMGSLRAAAQLISYEIPLIMALLGVAMLSGTLNLVEIVNEQSPVYALVQPLGLFIFIMAGLAELGRTPFDIYHAESEIMGGPFIEYSGAHWSVFNLAEYINTFAMGIFTALFFLGGWKGPFDENLGPLWLFVKAYLVIMAIFWFRGTFPRLRIDQLMEWGWKVLVPLSFVNIVITAIQLFYGWPWWSLTLISLAILVGVFYIVYKRAMVPEVKPEIILVSAREVRDAK